ncbi:MAG TPA: glycerol-3-phosphate 1-O-acyltransferase PlsY [Candidatus Omnitrophota bacterium]|nr:glycerol-3-phosphate 1-O-acyltransferase PlsY [Candidatus Omnitrophota bacterium]
MLWIAVAIIISYLIGSIPTAYVFGRARGIDIRQHGSGNVGATNALRVLGKKTGIIVLGIDILKGLVPVIFLGNILSVKTLPLMNDEQLRILIALMCIVGHNWTVFLNFKGGKGMATSLGVLIGLATKVSGLGAVLGIAMGAWLVIFFAIRIVSLASIISALILPLAAFFIKLSPLLIGTSIVLCAFIIIRHKANIARLVKGKEPRLSFKKK